jgi:predicted Fe-S protein YdhL (DUF1289 family)
MIDTLEGRFEWKIFEPNERRAVIKETAWRTFGHLRVKDGETLVKAWKLISASKFFAKFLIHHS